MLVFVGKQPLIPLRRIVASFPDLVVQGTTELRHNGVLGSSHWTLVGGIIPVDYSRMVIPSERGENLK